MRPDAFAAVMATGIVSIAAADHGVDVVSVPLAVVAAVALPVLIVATAHAWRRDSWHLRDLDTAIALFTYVAACAVLVARFGEHEWVVWVLGAMALQGWVTLMPVVARDMWRIGWTGLRDRAHGGWELASVATSGLAIVFVEASILFWALIFWLFALCVYGLMTGLVLWRAAYEPAVRRNVAPDHWILMGGLAIATLAGDHIHGALHSGPFADAVRVVTIVTWVLATLWILPLACVGWRRIRDSPRCSRWECTRLRRSRWRSRRGGPRCGSCPWCFFWIAFAAWLLTSPRFVHPHRGERGIRSASTRGSANSAAPSSDYRRRRHHRFADFPVPHWKAI